MGTEKGRGARRHGRGCCASWYESERRWRVGWRGLPSRKEERGGGEEGEGGELATEEGLLSVECQEGESEPRSSKEAARVREEGEGL